MVETQVNIPRGMVFPTYAGDIKKYTAELTFALNTHFIQLWARAETVAGNINLTGVLKIDDVQVVSSQGAHVADATDAASVITQLNLLLTRLETHGLLASV